MALLTADFLPNTGCILNSQFGLGIPACAPHDCTDCYTQPGPYPGGCWLIWPILLFIFHILTIGKSIVVTLLRTCRLSNRSSKNRIHDNKHNIGKIETGESGEGVITQLMLYCADKLPYLSFCCAFFIWYHEITHASNYPFAQYLEATSMVFLFGWMLTFLFVSGVTKVVYIFYLVLKEILIKDLVIRFSLIIVCTVTAFGFAFHALEKTTRPDEYRGVNITIYETLMAAMNMGSHLYDATEDASFNANGGRLGFFKVLVATYVIFT